MRRFLLVILTVLLGIGLTQAVALRAQDMHTLKKQQKMQRRQLKEQQRATKNVMKQHPLSRQEKARMKTNMKMQKQLLKHSQKEAVRGVKDNRKPLKQRHTDSRPATGGEAE